MALLSNDCEKIKTELYKQCCFYKEREKEKEELKNSIVKYSIDILNPIEKILWEKYPDLIRKQYSSLDPTNFSEITIPWNKECSEVRIELPDIPYLWGISKNNRDIINYDFVEFCKEHPDMSRIIMEKSNKIVKNHLLFWDIKEKIDLVISTKTSLSFLKNNFIEAYNILKS